MIASSTRPTERGAHTRQAGRVVELESANAATGRERDELAARLAELELARTTTELRIARCEAFVERAKHADAWELERAAAARAIDEHRLTGDRASADAERAARCEPGRARREGRPRHDDGMAADIFMER